MKLLSEYGVDLQKQINRLQSRHRAWVLGAGFPGVKDEDQFEELQQLSTRICRLHEQLLAVRRLLGSAGIKVPWLIKDMSFARSFIRRAWLPPDALRRRPIARNISAN